MGLCNYISEDVELICIPSVMDLISHIAVGTYEYLRRQSERNVPPLSPFCYGFMNVESTIEVFKSLLSIISNFQLLFSQ